MKSEVLSKDDEKAPIVGRQKEYGTKQDDVMMGADFDS